MQGSHLPLKVWFTAAHIVTSHFNGIPALQLEARLAPGSCTSAWILLQKLRHAMVDPDRSLPEGQPRRIRLTPIADFSAATLKPLVAAVAAPRRPSTPCSVSEHASLLPRPEILSGSAPRRPPLTGYRCKICPSRWSRERRSPMSAAAYLLGVQMAVLHRRLATA